MNARWLVIALVIVTVGIVLTEVTIQLVSKLRVEYVLLTAVVLGILAQVSSNRINKRSQKLGYRVTVRGGEWHVVYDEGDRSLSMNFEMGGFGHRDIVYVPSIGEWDEKMPEWARDRRTEIVERVIGELGTERWIYDGYRT